MLIGNRPFRLFGLRVPIDLLSLMTASLAILGFAYKLTADLIMNVFRTGVSLGESVLVIMTMTLVLAMSLFLFIGLPGMFVAMKKDRHQELVRRRLERGRLKVTKMDLESLTVERNGLAVDVTYLDGTKGRVTYRYKELVTNGALSLSEERLLEAYIS